MLFLVSNYGLDNHLFLASTIIKRDTIQPGDPQDRQK